MTVDRILGGGFALFGLFLFAYAIPSFVKPGVGGLFDFPNPSLFPKIAAGMFVLFGVMQMAFVRSDAEIPRLTAFLMFLLAAGITLAAMLLITKLGYLPVAFALMVAVCLITGERRPAWLGLVIVLLPLGTWLLFEQVLGRPLP